MKLEILTKALTRLGLTENDAKIYLLLAKEGPQHGKGIAKLLELNKQQLYRNLKRLRIKGIISVSVERPALFSAVSLEKVLDFLIESKREQALALQESREELLSGWRTVIKKEAKDN